MQTRPLFDDRALKRTFFSAPQSVTSLAAAFLEPLISVVAFLALHWLHDEPIQRSTLILCLLLFALTFPGRNRFADKPFEAATDIAASWLTLLAILLLCGYATKSLSFFDADLLLAWAFVTPLLQGGAVWIGQRVIAQRAASQQARRRAVVVGGGPAGVKVARALAGLREDSTDFAGYFDDRVEERLHDEAAAKRLGGLADAAAWIRANNVREVYITLALGSQPRIVSLLEELQGTTASLFFVPDVFGISVIQGRLQDVNGVPVVGILETPFTGTNDLIKRASDVVLASAILVLISPLLAFIALGVKLSSPGPIIFAQRRNGIDDSEIMVYKFRTMTVQENGGIVRQATRNDERITRFGCFLRRRSLDELPQFINVLQGHMSIVGPRPHAVAHNEEYRRLIKAYMVRHKVRPGITGWAQVHGHRGETDTIEKMQARVEYDLEYLRNWSLGLDLRIIARTIRLVLFDRHAY